MSKSRVDVSLVVACYNEEPLLEESIRQTVEILDGTPWSYEIIFVDDCSQDRTREIIDELLETYSGKNFRKLFHNRNTGRGRTVADGMRIARGDVVGYIDIDLEVHARYIHQLVLTIQHGADVSTAARVYKVQPSLFFRHILSAGYSWLMRTLLRVDLKDTEAGFKFFRREKVLPLLDETEDEGWFWDTEIMVRALLMGMTIVETPCLFIRRYDKQSTVNVFQDSWDYLVKVWRFRRVVRELRAKSPVSRPVLSASRRRLDTERS